MKFQNYVIFEYFVSRGKYETAVGKLVLTLINNFIAIFLRMLNNVIEYLDWKVFFVFVYLRKIM